MVYSIYVDVGHIFYGRENKSCFTHTRSSLSLCLVGASWIQKPITGEQKMVWMWFFFVMIAEKQAFHLVYSMYRIFFGIIFISACKSRWHKTFHISALYSGGGLFYCGRCCINVNISTIEDGKILFFFFFLEMRTNTFIWYMCCDARYKTSVAMGLEKIAKLHWKSLAH